MRINEILSRADVNRKRLSVRYSPNFIGLDIKGGIFEFNTMGEMNYVQRIQVLPVDWKIVVKKIEKQSENERFEFFKQNYAHKVNVKVYCDCSDFLYGGFAYIAHRLGYGLITETRPPLKRNRNLKGTVCKHLIAVLEMFR